MSGKRDLTSVWSSLSKQRRLTVAVTAIVVVVLLILLASLHLWNRHQVAVAQGECRIANEQYSTFESRAKHLDTDSDVQPATVIKASQVADTKTVDTLHAKLTAFTQKSPKKASCTIGNAATIRQTTAILHKSLNDRKTAKTAIVKAARAVVASRDAKSLADAKSSLSKAVKAAQGTLDSSHGKVADNKTRETLQKSLDAANKVLADKSVKDPQKYRDAQATLAAPVKGVNDSVAAKAAADKAAAAAQAAAQAQAQSRSSAGSSSSSSSSKSYSRSSGSTTQRKTTGSTAGSGTSSGTSSRSSGTNSGSSSSHSNSGGSSSGSGSGFDLTPSKPIQGCVDGKSVCPIG
ncbi:colicin transporter [Bifidobacterium aquikefiri]|uniref:Colicin transporter n=1 Tax=Bifidobacterium aquikefiri TaxID=1653207 RepID=A0A261G093_9BIFI|nr:hypothetical protein [Bifidobacterium aquikefiri]OZG64862.1 colicin transporter [Bifidobacterium aquikefiri]